MRDDDRTSDVLRSSVFERLDAVDVEMVGRLVEQQQVGLEREGQRQRRALALAARSALGRLRLVERRSDAGIR